MKIWAKFILASAVLFGVFTGPVVSSAQLLGRGPVRKPQVPPMPQPSLPAFQPTPLFQPYYQQIPQQIPVYQQGYQPPPPPISYGLNCYAGNLIGVLSQAAPIGL